MNELLTSAFARVGARVKLREGDRLRLDVKTDGHGEFFEIVKPVDEELIVLDIQPKEQHLLLLQRNGQEKHRFLTGFDERHFFTAAIPEATPVSTVKAAKEALKPPRVLRKNSTPPKGVIRQGEWFFVPAPDAEVDEKLILHDEPLTRGRGSKPHRCQDLYRFGGEQIQIDRTGKILTIGDYQHLDEKARQARGPWQSRVRNPQVFVRGRVSHTDHKTIILNGWHEVLMNTEAQAVAMKNVAMID